MLLRPGPIKALLDARFVDDHNVDKVPRIYIKTKHDRVVKPEQQDAMIKRWPPSEVYVLDSDHSPFFSTLRLPTQGCRFSWYKAINFFYFFFFFSYLVGWGINGKLVKRFVY